MNIDHLTGEQMDGLLSDPTRWVESEHLKTCADCSAEFESLLTMMQDLREAAKVYAEQHRRVARRPEASRSMPRMACAALTAAAILCIIGPFAAFHKPMQIVGTSAPVQQMQGSVSDAQLLSDVQEDLSSQVPRPMLPLAASVASAGTVTSTYRSSY